MKKLLTIVALALVLCLGASAALAVTFGDLNAKQQKDILDKLTVNGIKASEGYIVIAPDEDTGRMYWGYKDTKLKEPVLNCVEAGRNHTYAKDADGNVVVFYEYKDWDIDQNKAVNKTSNTAPAALVAHYGAVNEVKICTICGVKDSKEIRAQASHHTADTVNKTYSTAKPNGKVMPAAAWLYRMSDTAFKAWPCNAANKGKDLYAYKQCDECGMYYDVEQKYWQVKGEHSYPSTRQEIEPSTCITHGTAGFKCSQCGRIKTTENDTTAIPDVVGLPLGSHSYTKKVYEAEYDPAKAPNCKTGLVFVYTYQCTGGCHQYEGDLMQPDFVNHGYIDDELTLDEKAKILGWYAEAPILGTNKTYDADGHHYSQKVIPESGYTKYPCQSGYAETWACDACGLKKVFSNGEDKPTYNKNKYDEKKTVFTDCLHATITYLCDGCEGKVAGHSQTKTVTLKNEDALAHNGGKYFVEDLTKRVEPTCLDAGQQTLVCTECGFTKTVPFGAKIGHIFGDYSLVKVNANNDYVWERKCIFGCGTSEITTTTDKNKPKVDRWVETTKAAGTCLEASYVEYKHVNASGADILNAKGVVETKRIYGAYGDHLLVKVENYADEKKATCKEEGIELWICTRCTTYNPNTKDAKTLADCMTYRGTLEGGKPYYVVKKTEKVAHTWGEPVVVEATAEKDGTSTKTCTVCGEVEVTVIPFEKGAAEYKFADVKFDGNILSGKLVHTAGTKDADKLSIRVTFFTAGNNYMTTTATIYADGTFEAEGAGDIEAITLVAYATDKVVNPADVATLTKLDAKEIVVK